MWGGLGILRQDEKDILRQEYYDYRVPVPKRDEVIDSVGEMRKFNKCNYNVLISDGLDTRFQSILAAYRQNNVSVELNRRSIPGRIPSTATLTVSSAYRNPQKNKHKSVGSKYPDSSHTRGRALDLVPDSTNVTFMTAGNAVNWDLPFFPPKMKQNPRYHKILYPALLEAARPQANDPLKPPIAERGSEKVPVGDLREDHIHVQWLRTIGNR